MNCHYFEVQDPDKLLQALVKSKHNPRSCLFWPHHSDEEPETSRVGLFRRPMSSAQGGHCNRLAGPETDADDRLPPAWWMFFVHSFFVHSSSQERHNGTIAARMSSWLLVTPLVLCLFTENFTPLLYHSCLRVCNCAYLVSANVTSATAMSGRPS